MYFKLIHTDISCDFYKSNIDIRFIDFTLNRKPIQKRSKNLINLTCDTYLRVIQEGQNQKHLGIANQVRISKSKSILGRRISKNQNLWNSHFQVIYYLMRMLIRRIKRRRFLPISVNALKKCIEFFIGFQVIFLSFQFLGQSFFGLNSMKNVVNSKVKINLRSNLISQIGLDLNQRNHLLIFQT